MYVPDRFVSQTFVKWEMGPLTYKDLCKQKVKEIYPCTMKMKGKWQRSKCEQNLGAYNERETSPRGLDVLCEYLTTAVC